MITTAEDKLIARTQAVVPAGALRTVDSLPGPLTEELLRQMIAGAPAVYWSFLGGRLGRDLHPDTELNALWGMYVITAHANGNAARRRGDARAIGAYEILQTLLPKLNGYTVPAIGTLVFRRVENLFSVRLDKQGAALYAATFELPMVLPRAVDPATLASFAVYHAEHSLAAGADEPAAIDEVNLPQ